MSDDASGAKGAVLGTIAASAQAALLAAEILNRYNYGAYALHFSIVCWEECSKYLIAYCKDHLPDEYFKARFRHIPKFAFGTSLFFLSGGFSVIYAIQQLHDSGAFKEGEKGLAALVAMSLKEVGWSDAEGLAKTLLEHLSSEKTEEQKAAFEKSHAEIERLRTVSVYVDFDDDLKLKGSPFLVSDLEVKRWLENARLGVGMLNFLRSEHPEFKALIAAMPEEIREDVEEKSRGLIEGIKQITESASNSQKT